MLNLKDCFNDVLFGFKGFFYFWIKIICVFGFLMKWKIKYGINDYLNNWN